MYDRSDTMRMLNDTIGEVCDALENVHLLMMGSYYLDDDAKDDLKWAYKALEDADEKLSTVFGYLGGYDE